MEGTRKGGTRHIGLTPAEIITCSSWPVITYHFPPPSFQAVRPSVPLPIPTVSHVIKNKKKKRKERREHITPPGTKREESKLVGNPKHLNLEPDLCCCPSRYLFRPPLPLEKYFGSPKFGAQNVTEEANQLCKPFHSLN